MWGPGKEMMKAYEKNRSQLNKKYKNKSLKDNLGASSASGSKPLKFKEVSPQELESIKLKFLEKKKRENKKNLFVFFSIIAVLVLICFLIFS